MVSAECMTHFPTLRVPPVKCWARIMIAKSCSEFTHESSSVSPRSPLPAGSLTDADAQSCLLIGGNMLWFEEQVGSHHFTDVSGNCALLTEKKGNLLGLLHVTP